MALESPSATPGTHFVFVPHTHWDREWYRPFEDFRRRLVRLVDGLLNLLDADPAFACFHFDGQTITLDDYVEIRPQNAARLREHLRTGRIRVGPWRVLPDEFLVTGESLIRNLQQGHADCARWGVEPIRTGYTPDQFGHVGILPQVLSGFGLTAGMVWRGVGPDVRRTQFLWESPDGTRLFTVYLPEGYGNGASLPERLEPLLDRLDDIRREQADFCDVPALLVMNGSDHLEPQGSLPGLLAQAVERRPGWSFEMGHLDAFVDHARAAARDLTVHRGEFRHPWRANLLPGVTSVRAYQKQMDFHVCRMFEKYVEPMSVWAERLGDTRGAQDFIDYAWRLIIENHPHDSICGCSVDAVHDEMDTRWAKVVQVGSALEREVLHYLASVCATDRLGAGDGQALVTYSAARPAVQVVDVELYLDDPAALAGLRDPAGATHAVQLTPGERELFFETGLTADVLRATVAGLEDREILGYYLNNILTERVDSKLNLTLICGHQPYGEVDIDARRAELLEVLADPTITEAHVTGVSSTKTRLQAVLPVGGQTALNAFRFTEDVPGGGGGLLTVSDTAIETDAFTIEVGRDGSLDLFDKRTGREWPRLVRFVDDGDRGDTYNFDPVVGGLVVGTPTGAPTVRVVATGPVAATLAADLTYRVPAALAEDRLDRGAAFVTMPVQLEVTCYRAVPRIDLRVTIQNAARDHRVRAEIGLPFAPVDSIAEGPFGVVRRPVALPDMPDTIERFYGTAPTKGFVCVEDGVGGIALATRGIQEYEVSAAGDAGVLALTLLRCVGWLSRDDLAMRNNNSAGPTLQTPGAQSPGTHVFEFALFPYAGDYVSAGVTAQAHAYAYPPLGVRAGSHPGPLPPGTQFVSASHPQVVVSAATLTADRRDALVRVYNEAEAPIETDVVFGHAVQGVQPVDLRDREVERSDERPETSRVFLRMTPSQIRSWRVRGAPAAP